MASPVIKKLQSPEFCWSAIPPEVLELIFTKLPTISAQIRFRSVCTSWRSAAKSTKPPPGLPLLASTANLNDASTSTSVSFLSPSTGTTHSIDLPEAQGYVIRAHSAGWLVLISKNQDSLLLLNPLTHSTIRLPSAAGTFHNALQLKCYAFMAPYAEDQRKCAIALIQMDPSRFVYCSLGDAKWTEVQVDVEFILSVAYLKGRFYVMAESGDIGVWDVNDGELMKKFVVIPGLNMQGLCCICLAAMDEDLLMIGVRFSEDDRYWFEIYKLDACGVDLSWKRLSVLGVDRKVFLVPSVSCSAIVSEAYGCRGNTIYVPSCSKTNCNKMEISAIDVENGSEEPLLGQLDVPSDLTYQCFYWFTPRFC